MMRDEKCNISRRAFYRTVVRAALLGGVSITTALLVARRNPVAEAPCINKGICRGCGVVNGCGLPAALSYKRSSPSPFKGEGRGEGEI